MEKNVKLPQEEKNVKLSQEEKDLQLESLRKNLELIEKQITEYELKKSAIVSLIDKVSQGE